MNPDTQGRSKFGRRQLLQFGGAGLLATTLGDHTCFGSNMSITKSEVLESEGTEKSKDRNELSCIFIHQYGGLSQLDSWDMKPDAPAEIRGPYRPIQTASPGFQVCELMPRLAKLSEKYSVIRSLSHKMAQHDRANAMMLAGKSSRDPTDPSLGAMVNRLRPASGKIPGHVWLQKYGGGAAPPDDTYLSGGFLGPEYAPMLIGKGHDENPANDSFRVRAFDVSDGLTNGHLRERRMLGRQLESLRDPKVTPEYSRFESSQARAFEIIHGDIARNAFDVSKEPGKIRDRYGRNPLGQNLLMARRLIESGSRFVNVLAWTGLGNGEKFVSVETWDMHGNADVGIFEDGWNGLPFALPRTDQAVATLLEDLEERNLLDNTLVVLCGEFGRTPKIKRGAKRIGRDHWPNCYSAMIAGGRVQGGVVYGETDRYSAFVKSNPVSLEDFTATLFSALKIKPASRLSQDGFTSPASQGNVIEELLKG